MCVQPWKFGAGEMMSAGYGSDGDLIHQKASNVAGIATTEVYKYVYA